MSDDHRLYWCATAIFGDQAVGKNFIAYPGDFTSVVEYRIQFDASPRWTQVVQANVGWDQRTQVASVGRWAGLLGNTVYHCTSQLDAQLRAEWFDDEQGVRTGVATNYCEITGGLAARWGNHFMVRPELRGDFAGRRVFGPLDSLDRQKQQLTAAFDCVVTF